MYEQQLSSHLFPDASVVDNLIGDDCLQEVEIITAPTLVLDHFHPLPSALQLDDRLYHASVQYSMQSLNNKSNNQSPYCCCPDNSNNNKK